MRVNKPIRVVLLFVVVSLAVGVAKKEQEEKNMKEDEEQEDEAGFEPDEKQLQEVEVEIQQEDGTYRTEDELTLDRYFASLPQQYIYAFCAVTPDSILPKSSQRLSGTIDFRQSLRGGPTDIKLNMSGFDPEDSARFHGVHIHEYGDLSQGCSSAGGHYDPFGVVHGGPLDSPQFRHFGDLGNVEEDKKGQVNVLITDYLESLLGPFSILGRSFVVHEGEDDLGRGNTKDSLISGNAGPRLACCTIGLSNGDRWHQNKL